MFLKLFCSGKSFKNSLLFFLPSSVSKRLGLLFNILAIFENSSVFVQKNSFFKGIAQQKLQKLSVTAKTYLYQRLLAGWKSFISKKSDDQQSLNRFDNCSVCFRISLRRITIYLINENLG